MSRKNPFNDPPIQHHDFLNQIQHSNLPKPPVCGSNVFDPNRLSDISFFSIRNLFNDPPVQQHDFWKQLQQSNLPEPPVHDPNVFHPHKLSDFSSFPIQNPKQHHKH
jgi:hypothetical protein